MLFGNLSTKERKKLQVKSKRRFEEIYEKTAHDTYFYGEDAVEYGLADKIIYHI